MSNIIIIGAARSGTNMMRDLLVQIPGFATWPCDEINYIWRHGLKTIAHDEFSVNSITSEATEYINKKFNWVKRKYNAEYVVEKTCANSLRVDYVDKIVDAPKFVFIYRDPIDVVASAELRWKAPLDISYILQKARFVPFSDLPYYGLKYLRNRITKILSSDNKLSYWGPKYADFDKDSKQLSAIEISAIQWKKSVESSYISFNDMKNDKYIAIEYNDFVNNPHEHFSNIISFLGVNLTEGEIENIIKSVSSKSVGKGYKQLNSQQIKIVKEIVGNTYEKAKKLSRYVDN